MDHLDSHLIQEQLSAETQKVLGNIHIFPELDSTNSWLLEHKYCNDVCLAEKQKQGRGRRGNVWSSPDSGNIYLSLSWCFDEIPDHVSLISLLTGISLCEALNSIGLKGHGLKWPNDIYIHQQKLAGILVESSGDLRRVVIGIGLNVQIQDESSWCGLHDVLDDTPDRNTMIAVILNVLVKKLAKINSLSFEDFNQQWLQWDIVLDKAVFVFQNSQQIKGIARGIDETGQILIETDNGEIQSFHSAEISLRW
ncbi:MAG: biotin--[acetyl-CoA-carboxylase] ligase [Thiotrichaceae bacterium]